MEADIDFEEVKTAVNQLKEGRFPGLDNIPGEVFKIWRLTTSDLAT